MRPGILLAIILLGFSCGDTCDYYTFLGKVSELEENGNYHKAMDLVLKSYKKYPNQFFDLLKEQVYINEKLGEYESNLDIFRNAHEKGYFFLIHPSIPRLKPYLDLQGFDEISKTDLKLRNEAIRKAKPRFEILEPSDPGNMNNRGVLFIYHGGGSSIEKEERIWDSAEIVKNYFRVYMQSHRHSDYNTFGWQNSDSCAVSLLREAYQHLCNEYKIDTSLIICAGISAGATSAAFSAFRSSVPVKRLLLICTGIPEQLSGNDYSMHSDIYVTIIAGEKDHYRPRQERFVDSLNKYSVRNRYRVIPSMGHEYPPDFNILLNEEL